MNRKAVKMVKDKLIKQIMQLVIYIHAIGLCNETNREIVKSVRHEHYFIIKH